MNLSDFAPDETDRVLEVVLSEDKKHLLFQECCDYYFEAGLTKEQVDRFIEGLRTLQSQMEG